MKLFHLSDLHLGKKVNEFSMLEDQRHILEQIINDAKEYKPDGILIAGDIYDKTVPQAEAVSLFDWFLTELAEIKQKVFIISGNHDSAQRIAFGEKLMQAGGVYFSPVFQGNVAPITVEDKFGEVDIFLIPFVKPVQVRKFYPESQIDGFTDAMKTVIEHLPIKKNRRNIAVVHQFVTGALRSDSEERFLGGLDNMDASIFDVFDYTALGHIHRPQNMGEKIRYCGSPLKYSFSEASYEKSITLIHLGKKGEKIKLETLPLVPLHDMRKVRGSYMELTNREHYMGTKTEDYLHITLTDEEDVPEAMGRLRAVYPNLMKLEYDNRRSRELHRPGEEEREEGKSPQELISELYEIQNNQKPTEEQLAYIEKLTEKIWNGGTD